ncbi:glycosyltransferase family 2 protein [Heyndrickxia ginsengihumi]|uniref:glycosyltransferase family 2 protein n=1 Tax=Heyndrickxia ginsengihumi TaxID=363870 RepID=UPI003D1950D1
MSNALVTVFMTVFNGENYIKSSLESILNQTYKNIEILIFDDGSKDNTNNIIKSYKDSRIKLITNPRNMGIPYNRIKGLELAKGKYLAIMDADDISLPYRIQEQVNYMENNPNILAAGSFAKIFGKKFNNPVIKPNINPEEISVALMFYNPLVNSTAIFRLDKVKKFGINYNPNYFVAQDYDFWAQLSKKGKISNIPKVLLKYRFGHNNITKISNLTKLEKRKNIIHSIQNSLLEYYGFELTGHEKQVFNNIFDENNPIMNEDTIKFGQLLINKMILINSKKNIFDSDVFKRVLNYSIEESFKKSKIDLWKKIKYWRFISNRSIFYIFIKSSYYSLRDLCKSLILKSS